MTYHYAMLLIVKLSVQVFLFPPHLHVASLQEFCAFASIPWTFFDTLHLNYKYGKKASHQSE
ncbi:unnamed protein product [Brugia timori]|uniref:Secreted protein n=1 Tax=Brugia timori TaxID=42155 RepID=A0A3P7T0Y5_9BILA|nr:unnamed protein product [Brugia timori]